MSDVTHILNAVARGDDSAPQRLLTLVYEELRRMAGARLRQERRNRTLQTTDLVHEAYLRLFGADDPRFQNRAHFFAAAGEAMRRILVESARRRGRAKRGGGWRQRNLDGLGLLTSAGEAEPVDILAIHEALGKLEEFDPRAADIVKLRCFVGMNIAQIADCLGQSTRTVNRDWQVACAWLRRELAGAGSASALQNQ